MNTNTATTTAKHIGTFGTSQMHEFRSSGCAHQWGHNHDHHECWIAFLRYNNAPSDTMTVTEYYDSLGVK